MTDTPPVPPDAEDPRFARLGPHLSRQHIFETLYAAVQYAIGCGVPGDIAEFGTGSGETGTVLAKALSDYDRLYGWADQWQQIGQRRLWLFDSFEGFPIADNAVDAETLHIKSGVWGPGTAQGVDAAEMAALVGRYLPAEKVSIVPGWYKDTLGAIQPGAQFAVLHVDCDFYGSTLDVLDRLFALEAVADGCMILFDDWDCNRADPAVGERRAWAEIVEKYAVRFTDNGPYGFSSRRLIVHRPR